MYKNNQKHWEIGVGLRVAHYHEIFDTWPDVGFFEIVSENYLQLSGMPKRNLDKILSRYPVVMHGVSLNLGSVDPLNEAYLKQLKRLADYTDAAYVTDHLCWTGVNEIQYHDLLPLPYTEKIARHFADRIRRVQDYLNRPFGIENLSSYVHFEASEMPEWEFLNRVIELSGCHYMFDINNVYVSAINHGFDPLHYLEAIRWENVLQCHIAGHSVQSNGLIIDTHDNPVADAVWRLYQYAWQKSGGFKTLLEWDDNYLSFSDTHAEALKSKQFQISAETDERPVQGNLQEAA